MSLPFSATHTCDIYRGTTSPPAAPDVAGVPCVIRPNFVAGQEAGDRGGGATALTWTHLLLVALDTDIRDGYTADSAFDITAADHVFVPDQTGQECTVRFVEVVGKGTPTAHKRAYIDRRRATYPMSDL